MSEMKARCPKCDSPAPHLHPAVQFEGEVAICGDEFHKQITSENTEARIKAAEEMK